MRKTATAVATVLLIAASAADIAVASPPEARVAQAYVDSSGVVHYPYEPTGLPGAVLVTQRGSAEAGECVFSESGSGTPSPIGPVLTVGHEVTFDPATCTRVLAQARYPVSNVPRAVADDLAPSQGTAQISSAMSSEPPAQTTAGWYISLSARVQDPIGIAVSSTKTDRTWSSSGAWSNNHTWGWYKPTGWARKSHSVVDSATIGDTRGTFQNMDFCNPWAATDTDHSRTRVSTSTSGTWTWSYTMRKSGDCSFLLSYHYSLVTP